jgi:hypothetical protein
MNWKWREYITIKPSDPLERKKHTSIFDQQLMTDGAVNKWSADSNADSPMSKTATTIYFFWPRKQFVTVQAVNNFVYVLWRFQPSVNAYFVTDLVVNNFLTDLLQNFIICLILWHLLMIYWRSRPSLSSRRPKPSLPIPIFRKKKPVFFSENVWKRNQKGQRPNELIQICNRLKVDILPPSPKRVFLPLLSSSIILKGEHGSSPKTLLHDIMRDVMQLSSIALPNQCSTHFLEHPMVACHSSSITFWHMYWHLHISWQLVQ